MLSSKWLLTAVLLQCLCRNLADFGPIILSGSLPHTSSLSGHVMGGQGGRNDEGVKKWWVGPRIISTSTFGGTEEPTNVSIWRIAGSIKSRSLGVFHKHFVQHSPNMQPTCKFSVIHFLDMFHLISAIYWTTRRYSHNRAINWVSEGGSEESSGLWVHSTHMAGLPSQLNPVQICDHRCKLSAHDDSGLWSKLLRFIWADDVALW